MTEYEQFIMRYQGRNNERKRKGIPMRRKIVHNKGAYRKWIGTKLKIMMNEIMSRVISTRPYPYPVSSLEKKENEK